MLVTLHAATDGAETTYARRMPGFPSIVFEPGAYLSIHWGNRWHDGTVLEVRLSPAEAHEFWRRLREEYLVAGRRRQAADAELREHNRQVDAERVARHNTALYDSPRPAGNDCSDLLVGD